MRTPLIALLVLMSLSGCQATGLGLKPPSGVGLSAPLRLGSLEFKAVSEATARALAGQQQGAARAEAAPAMAARPAGVGADAMVTAPYGYGGYHSGPFGQMKLESVTEASAPGARGTFSELVAKVVGPAIAEWAADARLVEASALLDAAGENAPATQDAHGPAGWRLVYAAPSRSEVLQFQITSKATQVVRLRWTPVALDPTAVKVDARAAVAALKAAIANPSFRSKEDQLGRDYFFGANQGEVSLTGPTPTQIPPTKPTLESEGAIAPGAPDAPEPMPYEPPKQEPLYELTPGGAWTVRLAAIGEHLVWEMHYAVHSANRISEGEPWVDSFAHGMVDARTGEVIRLRRPQRFIPVTQPGEKPQPLPSVLPEPGPVRPIASGQYSAVTTARQTVATTEAEWARLYAEHDPKGKVPAVDFAKEMVVAVFLGERPSGGHTVSIVGAAETNGELVVAFRETKPTDAAASVITQPFAFAAVPKTAASVRFEAR